MSHVIQIQIKNCTRLGERGMACLTLYKYKRNGRDDIALKKK